MLVGLALLLLWGLAETLIVGDAWRTRDHAIETLEANARQATEAKARELSQLMTDLYVTTRTISLLPAVRRAPPRNRASSNDDAIDGQRFTESDAQTVLQLYHHLADVLSVSEIYIVYDGFAPQRGEAPFLMFDSIIVERFKRLTAAAVPAAMSTAVTSVDEPEQDEEEEYAALVGQLDQFRRDHPALPAGAPHGIANLVSHPLLTCDNSQFLSRAQGEDRNRTGLLFSVPIYDDATGLFKGLVTTVVRLNVLEAKLLDWPLVPVTAEEWARLGEAGIGRNAPSDYVLRHEDQGIVVSDRRNAALAPILAGDAQAGLALKLPLDGPAASTWRLERHVPHEAFASIRAAATERIMARSAVATAILAAFAIVAMLLHAQRAAAVRLREEADYDPLTGLPNRRQLDRRLEAALRNATETGSRLALIMVDLDNFKTINDLHGHHVGDLLLKEVARRFQKQVAGPGDDRGEAAAHEGDPRTASIGRLGGDEFLLVVPDAADDVAASELAERLLGALTVPVIVEGRSLQARASLGVAVYPLHGRTAAQLMRSADQAMYAAKRIDDSAVVVFQREVDHEAVRRRRLMGEVRDALAQSQFELHYQPVVRIPQLRVESVEALLRWRHPELGLIPPGEFVPLLERSGLIVPVGLWALRRACQQLAVLRASSPTIGSVSVNVSVVQLAQSDFSGDALSVIAETGVDPQRITMEVTESVLMENPQRSIQQLEQLRGAGVRIAIDDFGAGYSSLGYLRRLPVQAMKIDRSLLIDAVDPNGRSILAAMVQLAQELDLDCIAEGVETLEQYHLLTELGCPRVQGYLFARPLPVEDAARAARRMHLHHFGSAGGLFTESCFGRIEPRSGFAALGAS